MKRITLLLFALSFLSHPLWAQITSDVVQDLNPSKFNTDFSNFDQGSAIFTAHLSDIVYQDESTIGQYVAELNKTFPTAGYQAKFIEHSASSTQAMLFGNKDFVVVAFRGTQEKKDLVTDMQLVGKTSKLDRVKSTECPHLPAGHLGFRTSLSNLISPSKADIFARLDEFIAQLKGDKSSMKVYSTGHSLGAALSSLFVVPLKNRGYQYGGSYNFAPPLAVAKADAEKIIRDASIYNVTYDIVNNMDYITSMPKSSQNTMKHIGKYYRICSISTAQPLMYQEKESDYKVGFFERFSLKKARIDQHHFLSSYIKGVRGSENTNAQVATRSASLGDCSCLNTDCK